MLLMHHSFMLAAAITTKAGAALLCMADDAAHLSNEESYIIKILSFSVRLWAMAGHSSQERRRGRPKVYIGA
jgi:hypothetical protein